MSAITKGQIKVIWSIWRRAIGLEADELYELIKREFGVERLHELSYREADELIRALRVATGKEVPGMASYAQRRAILNKMKRLGWDEGSLRKFMERVVGKSHIRFLTADDARKVLAGMTNIEKYNLVRKAMEKTGMSYRELKKKGLRELRRLAGVTV